MKRRCGSGDCAFCKICSFSYIIFHESFVGASDLQNPSLATSLSSDIKINVSAVRWIKICVENTVSLFFLWTQLVYVFKITKLRETQYECVKDAIFYINYRYLHTKKCNSNIFLSAAVCILSPFPTSIHR